MNQKIYTSRNIALLSILNLLSGIGCVLLYDFFSLREFTVIKWIVFSLFIILFTNVSYGATISILGFWVRIAGGDSHRILETIKNKEIKLSEVEVAIVMPIYGENIEEVCARIETMYLSLGKEKESSNFDFFILSDTRELDKWVKEEEAYIQLCKKLNAFERIYYRRRKLNLNKKSGNIADFCRRWGNRYKYMIVLDADSLMTGKAITTLTKLMEVNPSAGIIQSYPKLIRAETLFQKIMQYTSIVHGDIFSKGANYWQQNSSSFWGHNAIIRLKPFMEYCGLPALPKLGAIGGKILSHDTIEAALIRKEGFSVWSAYDLEGSYEETPPNLIDSLKRDERWCQGNLQHFWFLFAKGLSKSSRVHIFLGILSYLSSFLWLLFLIGTIFLYIEDVQFFRLSMEPGEWKVFWDTIYFEKAWKLASFTYTILFLPRIITLIDSLFFLNYRKSSIAFFSYFFSYLLEFLFSVFLAPILMFMHTKFILLTILGKRNEWKTQNRSSSHGISFIESLSIFYPMSLLGLVSGIYFSLHLKTLFYLFMPIWISWLISPFLAYLSSFNMNKKVLFYDEDLAPFEKEVKELKNKFKNKYIKNNNTFQVLPAIFIIAVDPFYNSLHSLFQKFKGKISKNKEEKINRIVQKLLKTGPQSLSKSEEKFILNDSRVLRQLYYKFWDSNIDEMDEYWKKNFRLYKSVI